MAEAEAGRLALYIHAQRQQKLTDRLQQFFPKLSIQVGNDPAGFEIVVNATPMGMEPGDPLPVDVERISKETMVGEVVMKQEETRYSGLLKKKGV